jgi:U3 small nucleolar RNA-associated protein 22
LQEIFQEKDYLNHRYLYKRAYYLACLAAGIKSNRGNKFHLSFDYLHGNHLLPILIIDIKRDPNRTHKPFRIVLLPAAPKDLFAPEKLLPSKNCVRPKPTATDGGPQTGDPTPFYNASLRVDCAMTAYLKLQHESARQCEAYKDACILGRVWLRQRGLNSRIQGGGFGNFEWAIIIALLLRGGGPNGTPAFSSGYSSYQLFKATLQYLALKDLSKTPQTIGDGTVVFPKTNGTPIIFDAARGLNVTFKMTPWSYRLLQYEARTTISMLNDSTFDHFDAAFILRVDHPLCRYDVNVELPVSSLVATSHAEGLEACLEEKCQDLYTILTRGLMDRVRLVSIHKPAEHNWEVNSSPIVTNKDAKIIVGLVVDPTNTQRLIDHGPSAEDKKAAAAFRKFWGPKAELRRFKDGRIVESLMWSNTETTDSIIQQITSHILDRHFGEACVHSLTYAGDQDARLLAPGLKGVSTSMSPFQPMITAFQTLEKDIRGLDELPLQLRHVLASDSQLSYGSVDIPFTPGSTRMSVLADVVIQFEGSARWPDDLDAIQRTKIAFLLKLAELMEEAVPDINARLGLENEDSPLGNQSFLDLHYSSGAAFRLRIHHDREATLLERMLKTNSLSTQEKTETASALATYKRLFVRQPAHTQAMQNLATRFPALSPTIRLVKKWISSHLLSPYFSPSLIELIVVRTFTNPYPWPTPSSAMTGFLRTLTFLSRWDWRGEPWIVDLGIGGMKMDDVAAITTRFKAWRKIDPALNRVVLFAASNIDADGTTWTDHARPPKVIAARISALAKSAISLAKEKGLTLDLRTLFVPDLGDYDVIICLNPKFAKATKAAKVKDSGFKNLQFQIGSLTRGDDNIGYSPVNLFLKELEEVFGQAILFFYDGCGGDAIAGLWNPQTEKRPWKLKVGYSTKPVVESMSDDVSVLINKGAVLNEIARLGGGLVLKIEVRGK